MILALRSHDHRVFVVTNIRYSPEDVDPLHVASSAELAEKWIAAQLATADPAPLNQIPESREDYRVDEWVVDAT